MKKLQGFYSLLFGFSFLALLITMKQPMHPKEDSRDNIIRSQKPKKPKQANSSKQIEQVELIKATNANVAPACDDVIQSVGRKLFQNCPTKTYVSRCSIMMMFLLERKLFFLVTSTVIKHQKKLWTK